ncbi:ribonuclease III [Candidatus Saccharibacteria bacterium]|nr:ribonuclease III [Candidatus Saccharibacteria bacterium]
MPKNPRQKKALLANFERRSSELPAVPSITGIDFTPYQEFAKNRLGFEFKNPSLLVTALTHRSYVNEHKKSTKTHNERLEFLGDAVLEMATTEFLFNNFEQPEGILTSWRSALVRTESIAAAGANLNYQSLIRMSRGEKQGSEAAKLHIVANAFEALIGAIYLDQGYDIAKTFIDTHILNQIDDILENGSWRDPKSHLQEISQRVDNETPDYRVLSEEGPDHDKMFVVGVFVRGQEIGRGDGSSKQIAQQNAARQALLTYRQKNPKLQKLNTSATMRGKPS